MNSLRATLLGFLVVLLPGISARAAPEKALDDAVARCQSEAPSNNVEAGFAPFKKGVEGHSVGQNTYSGYDRILPGYPAGVFTVSQYQQLGLQYFVTLAGGGRSSGKEYAWTIISVPRIVKDEERTDGTLWDAVILERDSTFSKDLQKAAGTSIVDDFMNAKKESQAKVLPYNRYMATYTLAEGVNPRSIVSTGWRSLLGKWAMDNIIVPTYPKQTSTLSKASYDHVAFLHVLTKDVVADGAKYVFVSQVNLGTDRLPAFGFSIDSDGTCLAASRIEVR
jgi:hypothetical protein